VRQAFCGFACRMLPSLLYSTYLLPCLRSAVLIHSTLIALVCLLDRSLFFFNSSTHRLWGSSFFRSISSAPTQTIISISSPRLPAISAILSCPTNTTNRCPADPDRGSGTKRTLRSLTSSRGTIAPLSSCCYSKPVLLTSYHPTCCAAPVSVGSRSTHRWEHPFPSCRKALAGCLTTLTTVHHIITRAGLASQSRHSPLPLHHCHRFSTTLLRSPTIHCMHSSHHT
jgi:hypothetical protein